MLQGSRTDSAQESHTILKLLRLFNEDNKHVVIGLAETHLKFSLKLGQTLLSLPQLNTLQETQIPWNKGEGPFKLVID